VFHVKHLDPLLIDRAAQIGLSLSSAQAAAMLEHLSLLQKWNKKHNLVGPGSIDEWLERHTLDSLVIATRIPSGLRVLDVGSGAGFPGIPLAIARPDLEVLLAEARQKRAAFLQLVRASLGLRVTVLPVAVSPGSLKGRADVVLSRAVLQPEAWLGLAASQLDPGGRALCFFGREIPSEASLLELAKWSDLEFRELFAYQIAGQPLRAVASFQRTSSNQKRPGSPAKTEGPSAKLAGPQPK
jgi:16S rRNA (guanine527-N7)-methyltransferase